MEWFYHNALVFIIHLMKILSWTLLTLIVIKIFFKDDFNFHWISKIIKWILLLCAVVSLINSATFLINKLNIDGDYSILTVVSFVPPLFAISLLWDRLSRRFWFLFFISWSLYISWIFEFSSLVLSPFTGYSNSFIINVFMMNAIKGVGLAAGLLLISKLLKTQIKSNS